MYDYKKKISKIFVTIFEIMKYENENLWIFFLWKYKLIGNCSQENLVNFGQLPPEALLICELPPEWWQLSYGWLQFGSFPQCGDAPQPHGTAINYQFSRLRENSNEFFLFFFTWQSKNVIPIFFSFFKKENSNCFLSVFSPKKTAMIFLFSCCLSIKKYFSHLFVIL